MVWAFFDREQTMAIGYAYKTLIMRLGFNPVGKAKEEVFFY